MSLITLYELGYLSVGTALIHYYLTTCPSHAVLFTLPLYTLD